MSKANKIFSIVLSIVILFSTVLTTNFYNTNAASKMVYMLDLPRGDDPNKASWGHGELNLMNGWTIANDPNVFEVISLESFDGEVAYCIEPGTNLNYEDILTQKGSGYWSSYPGALNKTLSGNEIQTAIERILTYGFTGDINSDWDSSRTSHGNEIASLIATQMLIWETIAGERDINFTKISSSGGADRVASMISSSHPLRTAITLYYNQIENNIKEHMKKPSFLSNTLASSTTYDLTWNGSKYSVILTDTNNVLSQYNFSSTTSGVTFSISGNKLTVETSSVPAGTINITAEKKVSNVKSLEVWSDGIVSSDGYDQLQDVVVAGPQASDPILGYVKAKLGVGNIKIVKTTINNNGAVSGFQFEVRDSSNKLTGTYSSGSDGTVNINNVPTGTYSIKEINLPADFVEPTQNPKSVTVNAGETSTVTFENVKKQGIITVQKSNATPQMGDYSLEGAVFQVHNQSGTLVDTITTDADGKAETKELPLGTYRITEATAPYGYLADSKTYTATLSGGQGSGAVVYAPSVSIAEKLQTGKITIVKSDSETGSDAQGNAALEGAVFDLFDSQDTFIERLYCGTGREVTSKELPLGTYLIREVTAPKGYMLSDTAYPVTIEYAGQTTPVNIKTENITNDVIKGKIFIIKHTDMLNDEPGEVEIPLSDAVFEIYLKSAGSYANAKEDERDLIVTDENGLAETKMLPYGYYIVKETQAPEGKHIIAPFEVFISQDGTTYPFIINDKSIAASIKVVKIDAETGNPILRSGTVFKIKDLSTGDWVQQYINYPTPMQLDSYVTNEEGWLMVPGQLPYGEYELWEVTAPLGYLISNTPVFFEVKDAESTLITVTMENYPVKGTVNITKTGETLTGSSVSDSNYGELYKAIYEDIGLSGAVFEIIAAEDILTGDDTVRVQKGTVVDTITTGESGTAVSAELYLGNYVAVEIEAPYGYVLNEEEHSFSLIYENQEEALVFSQISVFNEREKAEIHLDKLQESYAFDENGIIHYTEEAAEGVTFGLFAKEDIIDYMGECVIPADSLLEILVTDSDGHGVTTADIPYGTYYIKELKANTGYILDESTYDVDFYYENSGCGVVVFYINEQMPMVNKLVNGSIKVIKTDENEKLLSDAEFTVFTSDDIPVAKLVTDQNGMAETGLLPFGTYKVMETKAPQGYVINDQSFNIEIIENESTVELTCVNKRITGKIKVIKTDGKTKTPLEDVVFEIRDSNKKIIQEITTDKNGIAITDDLEYGDYSVIEKKSQTGYILDTTVHEIEIREHAKVYELQLKNVKATTPAKSSAPAENKTTFTSPQTSDTTETGNLITYWLCLTGSLFWLAVLVFLKRKNKMLKERIEK